MQTVVETPEYLVAARKAGMTENERREAVDLIAANPSSGTIMPGTGGCRKVRIARQGAGKSGVISKGKRANLTKAQQNELRKGK